MSTLSLNGADKGKKRTLDGDAAAGEWTTVTKKSKKEKKPKAKQNGSTVAKTYAESIDQAIASGEDIATPLFQFVPAGFKSRQVGIAEIRDLILNVLARASYPKWVKISNKQAIRGVVCVLIQGIEPATLGLPNEITSILPQPLNAGTTLKKSKLPVFQRLFSHYCPTRAPGDQKKLHSVLQTLLSVPLSQADKDKKQKQREKVIASSSGSSSGANGKPEPSKDPSPYLMQPDQFLENGYIVPTYPFDPASRLGASASSGNAALADVHQFPFEQWQRPDGTVETPQIERDESDDPPLLRILGIDCEMCVSTVGSEVCRVSVVDGSGKLIYNSLVKPANPITDYATVYSGITAEMLEPVTTTLLDVQKELAKLIDFDTVLVGHSLNCDLVVLKLAHPWVIDTSVIYHHTRGPPYKASLKWLAGKWLQKQIQRPSTLDGGVETLGHNSEEDARAAVELVNMKIAKGPAFGEFAGNDQESLFERIAKTSEPRRRTAIVDHGNPAQWHGSKADTAVACKTDSEVTQGVLSSVKTHDFVFARFLETSHALGWSQASNSVMGKTSTAVKKSEAVTAAMTAPSDLGNGAIDEPTAPDASMAYSELNKRLQEIYDRLPLNTAFIVLSGHSDPRAMTALNAKKNRFDILYKTTPLSKIANEDKWMEQDERELLSTVARVREGMTFMAIKR